MDHLTAYLLTVANLYTAPFWVAINIPLHEPNTVIIRLEWCLIAVAIILNIKNLASYFSRGEAIKRTEENETR